jgi:hypothetical protein
MRYFFSKFYSQKQEREKKRKYFLTTIAAVIENPFNLINIKAENTFKLKS